EAHSLIRAITDNATTAIFMVDGAGATTFMNPAAEAMIGYRFEEIRGQSLHALIHAPQADGSPVPFEASCIGASILTRQVLREHEESFINRAGEVFPVRCNASPIVSDGVLSAVVLEVRDITVEKRAQRSLE